MSIEPAYPTRRSFLSNTAFGVGAVALAHLLREEGLLADPGKALPENHPSAWRPGRPTSPPRRRR